MELLPSAIYPLEQLAYSTSSPDAVQINLSSRSSEILQLSQPVFSVPFRSSFHLALLQRQLLSRSHLLPLYKFSLHQHCYHLLLQVYHVSFSLHPFLLAICLTSCTSTSPSCRGCGFSSLSSPHRAELAHTSPSHVCAQDFLIFSQSEPGLMEPCRPQVLTLTFTEKVLALTLVRLNVTVNEVLEVTRCDTEEICNLEKFLH